MKTTLIDGQDAETPKADTLTLLAASFFAAFISILLKSVLITVLWNRFVAETAGFTLAIPAIAGVLIIWNVISPHVSHGDADTWDGFRRALAIDITKVVFPALLSLPLFLFF